MQSINVVVLNPWFLGVFMGTALLCSLALLDALWRWPVPGGMFVIAGGTTYLLGSLGVTMVCNVPRNESLRVISPTGTEAARYWTTYVRDWTRWNHVRTIASLAAAAAFSIALGR
jgi:uncharacterized membrane protein